LLPYNRIEAYFADQLGIPISASSLFNFNEQAATLVKSSGAEAVIKKALQTTYQALHVDETGIISVVNGDAFMAHQRLA